MGGDVKVGGVERASHETMQPTMQPTVQPGGDTGSYSVVFATDDLRPGMVLDGKYHLDSLIGRGGMGHVWRCTHAHLSGDIAVKILIDRLRGKAVAIERFWQEARLMGALGHPNIVRIYDVSPSSADVPYMAMELLPRESLRQHLKMVGTIEPEEAMGLLDGVLSALIAAHKRGIIHRDIKPENLMFADVRDINTDELRTELKVLDFGASILLEPGVESEASGEGLFGTPYYMSPEQAGGAALDHRSDLYSAAVVLYEMLSGEVPHGGDGLHALVFSIATDPAIPLETRVDDLPLSYYRFFDRALAMAPAERFQSASEMRKALRQLSGQLARVQRHTELYLKAIPDVPLPRPPRPGDTGPVVTWREKRPITGKLAASDAVLENSEEARETVGASGVRRDAVTVESDSESGLGPLRSSRAQNPGRSGISGISGASGSFGNSLNSGSLGSSESSESSESLTELSDTLGASREGPALQGTALIGRGGYAAVIGVALVGGAAIAYSLSEVRRAEGVLDWGEIGLAFLVPSLVFGSVGTWLLSRRGVPGSRA